MRNVASDDVVASHYHVGVNFGSHQRTAENSVLRLNYGVYFRAVRQAHVVTNYWAQVFHVQLPTVPRGSLHLIVPAYSQLNLRSCS